MKRIIVIWSLLMILSLGYNNSFAATTSSNQPPREEHRHTMQTQVKRSKPRAGSRVTTIPSNRIRFTYKNKPYYFHQGIVYILVDRQYEVVDLVEGMIIPDLPERELRKVILGKKVYYEYCEVIYQIIRTREGDQYQVVGWME
ncbi:MAG: DUF6515 family protein [Rikenellaceae bacterium]